jgi:hypothetical protein
MQARSHQHSSALVFFRSSQTLSNRYVALSASTVDADGDRRSSNQTAIDNGIHKHGRN